MIGIKFFLTAIILLMMTFSMPAEEVIVFLGDSITQLGIYPNDLQLWYALKYPRHKRIICNAGMAGNQAKDALQRLKQDVWYFKPDQVYIFFGINDIQRHLYRKEHFASREEQRLNALRAYRENICSLVDLTRKRNIGVTLIAPSPFDQYSALQHPCDGDINEVGLRKCTEELYKISKEKKIPLIDLFSPMTVLVQKFPGLQLCGADRIHPLSNGQRLIAALIFEKNNVPHPVIQTDYRMRTVSSRYCQIMDCSFSENCLSWKIRPEQLPFPMEKIRARLRDVYDFSRLDSMFFSIKGLPAGTWSLKSGNNIIASAKAVDWDKGIDLAQLDFFPPQIQAKKTLPVQKKIFELQTDFRICRLAETKIRSVGGNPLDSTSSEYAITKILKNSGNHPYYKYVFERFRAKQISIEHFFSRHKELVNELYLITQPEIFNLTLQKEN